MTSSAGLAGPGAATSAARGGDDFHRLGGLASYPERLVRGSGAVVHDDRGADYIDYVLGKGPIILGHAHPAVQRAAHDQLARGNLLGLATPVQVRAAELLRTAFHGEWLVRFHKTGSGACESAIRIARAFTERPWVLSAGYHGWHAACLDSPSSQVADFGYDLGELERLLERHRDEVAAIFVEPQPGFLAPAFYHELRALADAAGCLLAFDEVKTGFRVEGLTVHGQTQTRVELFTVSKAIANGFSLSAVVGRPDVMQAASTLHTAGTYDVEAIAYAAAAETLAILREPAEIAQIGVACRELVAGLDEIFAHHDIAARAFAGGTMFRLGFVEPEREDRFYTCMAEHGILFYPYDNQFVSRAHDAGHRRRTLDTVDRVVRQHLRRRPGDASFATVARWGIHQFRHRKGYLRKAPGPCGR